MTYQFTVSDFGYFHPFSGLLLVFTISFSFVFIPLFSIAL